MLNKIINIKSRLRLLAFLLTFALHSATSQSIKTNLHNFGVISWPDSQQSVGTGFVLTKQCFVITCSHVASSQRCTYKPAETKEHIALALVSDIPNLDLTVFKPDSCPSWAGLNLGCFDSVQAGDQIFYVGWLAKESALKICTSRVLSKGLTVHNQFLDFQTEGRPGFSGGPVLDTKGNVVAIVVQGWFQSSLTDSTRILVSRAFSTDTLFTVLGLK